MCTPIKTRIYTHKRDSFRKDKDETQRHRLKVWRIQCGIIFMIVSSSLSYCLCFKPRNVTIRVPSFCLPAPITGNWYKPELGPNGCNVTTAEKWNFLTSSSCPLFQYWLSFVECFSFVITSVTVTLHVVNNELYCCAAQIIYRKFNGLSLFADGCLSP
jgi:hypothetical protein